MTDFNNKYKSLDDDSRARMTVVECLQTNQQKIMKILIGHEYETYSKIRTIFAENDPMAIDYLVPILDMGNFDFMKDYTILPKHLYSLADYLDEKPKNRARDLEICWKIAKSLSQLHSLNIIHCDLRPENIFYFENESRFKIGNFSRAELLPFDGSYLKNNQRMDYLYQAPEVIRYTKFSKSADVFSFGILMYQILSRESVKKNKKLFGNEISLDQVRNGIKDPGLHEMIESILSYEPNNRLSSLQVTEILFQKRLSSLQVTEEVTEFQKQNHFSRVIISVDLGSTFSGTVFYNDAINYPTLINSESSHESKNRTCILYNKEKKLDSIGFKAYEKYYSLDQEEQSSYYFIEGVKQALFNSIYEDKTVIEANGEHFILIDVLADYLRELVTGTLELCHLIPNEVLWVTAVPANWEIQHVMLMKKIFLKAELIEDWYESIIFLLEPEAASVYVMKEVPQLNLTKGDKYLVVDCGGGTTNVSSVEVSSEGKLKTLRKTDAINVGSTVIDDLFMKYIRKEMKDFFPHLHAYHIHQIRKEWEKTKLIIDAFDGKPSYIKVNNLPDSVTSCPLIKRKAISIVKDSNFEKEVYEPVLSRIIKFIEEILKGSGIGKIVCVGGFSQSILLINRIKEEFSNIEVVVPARGSESVVKGAAYLGNDTSLISTRRSKYGYGIESEVEFNRKKHDPKRMKTYTGQVLIPVVCTGVYTPIIVVNQEMKENMVIERQFTKNKDEKEISVNVYRSTDRVQYIDDPTCSLLETLVVNVEGLTPGQTFRVRFSLTPVNNLQLDVIPDDIGKQCSAHLIMATVNRVDHFGDELL